MDKNFLQGIRVYKPRDNAPDFIIANIEINKSELITFLQSQPDKVRADLKRSKEGKFYLEVNTWQPKEVNPSQATKDFYGPAKTAPASIVDNDNSDLPF